MQRFFLLIYIKSKYIFLFNILTFYINYAYIDYHFRLTALLLFLARSKELLRNDGMSTH